MTAASVAAPGRRRSPAPGLALRRGALARLALAALLCACATPARNGSDGRRFDFSRDTFAYANELYWDYDPVADQRAMATSRRDEPIEYGQRCIVLVRAARLFFQVARFEPGAPKMGEAEYRERVRAVLASDPREERPASGPVAIPGYADLRSFSRDHDALLKQEIGGRLAAYLQRGNWRMIFPFSPGQQRASARELLGDVERGHPPIVHVVNFPRIDINHALLLIGAEETPLAIRFDAYDPNDIDRPLPLTFDRATATFHLPRTGYFAGGPVRVYEIYDGPFF